MCISEKWTSPDDGAGSFSSTYSEVLSGDGPAGRDRHWDRQANRDCGLPPGRGPPLQACGRVRLAGAGVGPQRPAAGRRSGGGQKVGPRQRRPLALRGSPEYTGSPGATLRHAPRNRLQRGQFGRHPGMLGRVGQPADQVVGQSTRFVFASQIFREQDLGIGRRIGIERAQIAAKHLLGSQQIDQRDVAGVAKPELHAVSRRADPIQNRGRPGVIEQFERDRSRHGQATIGRPNQLGRAPEVDFDRQAAALGQRAGDLRLRRLETGDREPHFGQPGVDERRRFQKILQIQRHFLRPRSRQNRDQRTPRVLPRCDKRLVQRPAAHFVKERMADERGVTAPLGIPLDFERQTAQHVVDQSPHFCHAPARPGPNLRRHVVKDRNAVCLRPPSDPPVEARVVDQHHGVGRRMAEIAVGAARQAEKLVQVEQHAQKPHHRQGRQIGVQLAPGGRHLRTAIADRFQIGILAPQLANQIGRVHIAARFADGKKDLHASRARCSRQGLSVWVGWAPGTASSALVTLCRVSASASGVSLLASSIDPVAGARHHGRSATTSTPRTQLFDLGRSITLARSHQTASRSPGLGQGLPAGGCA